MADAKPHSQGLYGATLTIEIIFEEIKLQAGCLNEGGDESSGKNVEKRSHANLASLVIWSSDSAT